MLGVDEATVKKVLTSWGPGKFDAELNLDGKAFRPDGKPAATLNPAGLRACRRQQSYLDRRLGHGHLLECLSSANLEMHGKGKFYDPRLDNAEKYPVAARTRQGHKR